MAQVLASQPTSFDELAPSPLTSSRHSAPQKRQVLIRFQNVTHVVNLTDNQSSASFKDSLLKLWSERTGWPLACLRLSGVDEAVGVNDWFDITIRSSIRGGKGGFGTLLKGQARQAGAKFTTDFGACRDLQGRRLRHVNDEIKLRKWREAQERKKQRKQAGGADEEKGDDDYLWKTPSGLYNWHLLTPTWSDLSKKAINRQQRHYKTFEQKAKREQKSKAEEERRILDESLKLYVGKTTEASENIQHSIGNAIQQGLQAQKAAAAAQHAKKRKRHADVLQQQEQPILDANQQPSSLVALSGEVVVEDSSEQVGKTKKGSTTRTLQMQSKSDFATAVYVLDQKQQPKQTLYYEIELVTGGVAQIGWANLVSNGNDGQGIGKSIAATIPVFEPNNDEGDGVGDDASSFAFDGGRHLKFHGGSEERYGGGEKTAAWKAGDIVGCLYNATEGTIAYSLNGQDFGIAFKLTPQQQQSMVLFPAVSCNEGEILTWRVREGECQHFPSNATAVHDLTVVPSKSDSAGAIKPESKSTETANKTETSSKTTKASNSSTKMQTTGPPSKPVPPAKPELLDLEPFKSAEELEKLGLDRLKSALMALQAKCG